MRKEGGLHVRGFYFFIFKFNSCGITRGILGGKKSFFILAINHINIYHPSLNGRNKIPLETKMVIYPKLFHLIKSCPGKSYK